MTSLHVTLRRGVAALALGCLLAGSAAGCAGPTNLAVEQAEGPYVLDIEMDPHTLNPPQLATLNFSITVRESGSLVTEFTPVYGALLHNVLISRDLLHFQHNYTGRVSQEGLSILTNFLVTGEYYNHTIFQPAGAELEHVRSEIATGTSEMRPDLVPDANIAKFSQGVQHDLLLTGNPLRAGQPSQLALFIREKGQPVILLEAMLAAPGIMFVTSQDGEHFALEPGAAPSRVAAPAELTPGSTPATAVPTRPATGSTPGAEPQQSQGQAAGAAGSPVPPPTLVPELANALASVTAQPVSTLVPVQQTAMASILETPAVVPTVSYGPYVAFTHTFPEPGLYKLWFKTSYRQRVMMVDFVVRVEQ